MDHAQPPDDDATHEIAREPWRIELERRLDEAADIMAETLIDMWRAKTRAELDGTAKAEPTPDEPIRSPSLLSTTFDSPPRRVFRVLDRFNRVEVQKLLAQTWFPVSELPLEPDGGKRYRIVLRYGGLLMGVAVFDEYGDAAVLRAIAVRRKGRRRGHARALAAHVIRRAYEAGVGRVYCAAASPWFVEKLGFEFRERSALPEDAARLPGIVDAPPKALVFELTPTKDGHVSTSRTMYPRSATEFLKVTPDPNPARRGRRPGPAAEQKRQDHAEGEDHERR